jgi:hypothetical protein
MDCFDNIIGIHNLCTPVTPTSGFYIQDLRGINLSVANAAIDNETMSGITLIEEKITFSQNAILAHLRTHLADKLKINSIIQNDTVGFFKDNMVSVPLEASKLKGIRLSLNQYPYLEFSPTKIWLKLSQAITTDIFIYDLMTGELLDTLPITTVANTPTAIVINKSYFSQKQKLHLFICIDSSVSNTFQTSVNKTSCSSCNGSYSNRYISFSGGEIGSADQKIYSNITSSSGTNGLSLEYSLNCSLEPFLCNMGNQIAWPLLHKVGSEIMKELTASRRLNSIINIDKGLNEILQKEYEEEYMASMSALLNNMKVPNDICFNCNSRVRKAVAIP